MFSTNKKWTIFIVFMVMFSGSESFWLHTEKSLTAVRGGIISLPCKFSVHALAVYWYKHSFTAGAPEDGASLVARDYRGFTDPLPGFERFSITKDYSLFIRNITVHDETTYSCLVFNSKTVRGYTDLRVIALAEPLEPIVESCNVTAPGRCIYHVYTVGENLPEEVTLVCMVYNVRPPPGLTWIRSDGRVAENATQQMQEKDGLSNISSQIQVTMADFDEKFTCIANGDAVKGTSSMKITIIEDDVTTVSHDHGINEGLITSIVINFVLLILLVSCLICFKKCGFPGPLGAVKIQKPEPIGDFESQPLTDQEVQTATKLSQKIEALENQRKEDRASFEAEKREIESNWQKILHDQVEKLKTQELTVTKLSQKSESLENERKEDRTPFEEEKREIESIWKKILHHLVEKPKTQEFTARKLPKPEQLHIIEPKRSMEQEDLTKTELKQKIDANENEKRKNRAVFEMERLNTQEALTKTELDQKIEAYENEKRKNRAAFEKERLNTQGNELGMITLIIHYHDSGYIKQSHLKVNQHMQLEELKGKLCAKFRIHQSLIHFTHGGQNLSHGGPEDLKTVGLDDFSVLDVSKI